MLENLPGSILPNFPFGWNKLNLRIFSPHN